MAWCKILAFCVAVLATVTSAQYSVHVDLSKSVANIGDKLQVTCSVGHDQKESLLIVWVKRVGGTEEEIGANKYLNDAFESTGRYKAEFDYDDEKGGMDLSNLDLILEIQDVQPEDSGEIGCKIPAQKIEVFRQFTVLVPVESILLNSMDVNGAHAKSYVNNREVTFKEGHVQKFYCHVNGSYPKPEVTMTLGNEDITDQFELVEEVVSTGNVRGLKRLTYGVTLKNEHLVVDYSFVNKRLECRAVVPGSKFKPSVTGIKIKLAGYKPKFMCNNTVVVAFLQEDVHIKCRVHADPQIDHFRIYWSPLSKNNNITLEGNSSEGSYHAGIEDGETESEKLMTLRIDRIFSNHFRSYFFEAGNSLGKETHEIILRRDHPSAQTGSGTLPLMSLATLLGALLLWKHSRQC